MIDKLAFVLLLVPLMIEDGNFCFAFPSHMGCRRLFLVKQTNKRRERFRLYLSEDYSKETDERKPSSSYQNTDVASKGLVSALTNLVNAVVGAIKPDKRDQKTGTSKDASMSRASSSSLPPISSQELKNRIRDDYVVHNYLWTGQLDLACFQENCTFTDPTLSFQGLATYETNIQNLVPLVERFCTNTQSILFDIQLNDELLQPYIQTRWNMKGDVSALPWKPRIDVVGRTEFWYHPQTYQIYSYDEEWELPAYQALFQLVTTPGTIRSSTSKE